MLRFGSLNFFLCHLFCQWLFVMPKNIMSSPYCISKKYVKWEDFVERSGVIWVICFVDVICGEIFRKGMRDWENLEKRWNNLRIEICWVIKRIFGEPVFLNENWSWNIWKREHWWSEGNAEKLETDEAREMSRSWKLMKPGKCREVRNSWISTY